MLPLHRGSPLVPISEGMARANHGQFATEFSDSVAAYRTFLSALVNIEGVECIGLYQRYALGAVVGHLFDPSAIAEEIATCIGRHLYPEEEIVMGTLAPGKASPCSVVSQDEDDTPF